MSFPVSIDRVADLLGLDREPKTRGRAVYNVRCPFCDPDDGRHFHMNINTEKNVYFCPRCMDSTQKNTGALDLYGRVRFGTPLLNNGKELYRSLVLELESKGAAVPAPLPEIRSREILPADDDALDAAYRALLSLPCLALSEEHLRNLRNRGIDEGAAKEHHYATLPEPSELIRNHPESEKMRRILAENRSFPFLDHDDPKLAGALISLDLSAQKVRFEQVPGFYNSGGIPCFRYEPGMLIPTVSYEGRIVGLQVRRNTPGKNGLRYLTVSSKGFPGGVTTGIARVHVTGDTGMIGPDCRVLLTEGPLKADAALALFHKSGETQFVIIALQGVNSTKELPAVAEKLFRDGIREVSLALDMDKCGNIFVARAEKTIAEILKSKGLKVNRLYWDMPYAEAKERRLSGLCLTYGLCPPPEGSVFRRIQLMADMLHRNHIPYDTEITADGVVETNHWRQETKGIDDYLFLGS